MKEHLVEIHTMNVDFAFPIRVLHKSLPDIRLAQRERMIR
jgi:hypothetical protein